MEWQGYKSIYKFRRFYKIIPQTKLSKCWDLPVTLTTYKTGMNYAVDATNEEYVGETNEKQAAYMTLLYEK